MELEGSDTTSSPPPPPSPSWASELFGSRESRSSSAGIFGSIFPPPTPKVFGRESLQSCSIPKKPDYSPDDDAGDNNKTQTPVVDESESGENKERESVYEDQKVQPCHLSSSIYYGGQDIYSSPQSNAAGSISDLTPPAKKDDGVEDGSGIACRGNWWQGSLYY